MKVRLIALTNHFYMKVFRRGKVVLEWWVHLLMEITIALPKSTDIVIKDQGHAFVMLATKE